jgi:hypothetical protein
MTAGGTDPAGFGLRSGIGGPGMTTSGAGGLYLRALCGRTVLKCWRHCSISTWGFFERFEHLAVQQLIPELAVEGLHIAVLPRAAR